MLNSNQERLKAIPANKRRGNPLASLGGLTREASRIYRAVKAGKMKHEEGRSLVWILSQMRALVESQALERIEQRLEQLSGAQATKVVYGHEVSDRQAITAH